MSNNWDYATDEQYEEALDAYPLDSPKHPHYSRRDVDYVDELRKREKIEGPTTPDPYAIDEEALS